MFRLPAAGGATGERLIVSECDEAVLPHHLPIHLPVDVFRGLRPRHQPASRSSSSRHGRVEVGVGERRPSLASCLCRRAGVAMGESLGGQEGSVDARQDDALRVECELAIHRRFPQRLAHHPRQAGTPGHGGLEDLDAVDVTTLESRPVRGRPRRLRPQFVVHRARGGGGHGAVFWTTHVNFRCPLLGGD